MSERDDLALALFLLDPEPTVWAGILSTDHMAWFEVQGLEVLEMAAYRLAEIPGAVREAWYGLYAVHGGLEYPGLERGGLHALFQRVENMPEWVRLRLKTRMDALAAAFGAAHFAADLIDRLPEEARDRLQDASQAGERARQLAAELAAVQDLGGGDLETGLQQELEEARAQAAAAAAGLEEWLTGNPATTELVLAEALTGAKQETEAVQQAAAALGMGWGSGHGAPGREVMEGLNQLCRRIWSTEALRDLLESLGWAWRLVAREQRRSQQGRERLTHLEPRDLDLDQLADEELSQLLTLEQGSVEAGIFLGRALDGELLHARFEGREEAGRGPLVFVRDDSGSMHGSARASAAALQLALMTTLQTEGRRFVSIPFSGPGEFSVFDPGPHPDPAGLLEHLELRYGHGTEPYGPLAAALNLVREDAGCARADILLLTDGELPPPPAGFLEDLEQARQDPGLQLVTVVVGADPSGASFADRVVAVGDLMAERDRLAEALSGLV